MMQEHVSKRPRRSRAKALRTGRWRTASLRKHQRCEGTRKATKQLEHLFLSPLRRTLSPLSLGARFVGYEQFSWSALVPSTGFGKISSKLASGSNVHSKSL